MDYKKYSLCYKALGDETRTEIIDMLKGGKLCACKILEKFDISQPTLSYHLQMLLESGLVSVEKKGVWNHYSLNEKLLRELAEFLKIKECVKNICNKCD